MYPLATSAPASYEQLIRLARAVADSLADVTSTEQLASAWAEAQAAVTRVAETSGLPLGGLPVDHVAGVAFALRDREIRVIEHHQQQVHLIEAAVAAGEEWVLLHEQGSVEHGLMNAYQAIELHRPTGVALVSSVEQNPADGAANYVLTVIRMDPVNGTPTDIDPGIAETQEHADPDVFEASRSALRSLIESL